MKNFLILIPPSEGKTPGGEAAALGQKIDPNVLNRIKTLQSFDGDQQKLLGVKNKALSDAITSNQNILTSPTIPAIERYSGVVYQGIDYTNLSTKGKKYFDQHVGMISAIFGLVRPQQLIPDYKLKIEKLKSDKFWKPILSEKTKDHFVIDLLPQAHKKAIDFKDGISIDFILEKDGKRKPAGHNGKLIKGRFVRFLCENQIKNIDQIKNFDDDGFKWNGKSFVKVF